MPKANFPKLVEINGANYNFRLMDTHDRSAILSFAQHLAENDTLFMRRDITQQNAVDDWLRDLSGDRAISLLAEDGGKLVGYGTLYYNQLFWNRHLAELRIMIASPYRNRGLGTRLSQELLGFARELELEKVIAFMPLDDRGAQHVVEHLGFRAEAILPDWVKTRDERLHDLVIMSTSLGELQS